MFPSPHAADPVTQPGRFSEQGISGGHDDAMLRGFVNGNPQYGYAVVEQASRSQGGITFRSYDQYLWIGAGPMPRPGEANYPRPGGPVPPGWEHCELPKTTTDDFPGFLRQAEAAVAAWRAANPGAPLPEGQLRLVTPAGVPLVIYVRGGRVATVHFDDAWIRAGGAPTALPSAGGPSQ